MSSQGAGATAGNPQLLICDSDAVIQLFISNTVKVLREIKRAYGTQPFITPEVENELRTLPKYAKRIDASLTKAITNQTLLVLSQHALTQVVGKSAATFYPAIQALGAKYALVVHPGEAYSHAAAVTLAAPVLSHDINAIRTLQKWGYAVGSPTLRAFDLLVLGFRMGYLQEKECDAFRYQMSKSERNEWIPKAFLNVSFSVGLARYDARLFDGDQLPPSLRPVSGSHDDPLVLKKPGSPSGFTGGG